MIDLDKKQPILNFQMFMSKITTQMIELDKKQPFLNIQMCMSKITI